MTNICIYAITLKNILTANPKADALCLMKDTAMGRAKEQRRRRKEKNTSVNSKYIDYTELFNYCKAASEL